ncbi:MAG: class I SAM-dependent methyltransferase [Synergistaceae bacterium]|jgi:2-polyprenyl-3-methyl-5-hydroxy-6-metoxy-1,4-benzoquinol methylase|nr:class I SAM-dependent methyltransferase [Synergistaceae bacterium]
MDFRVEYWDREASKFDAIYQEDGKLRGWLNKLLRGDMEGRSVFAMEHACLNSHPRVLEIGCGTGIHSKGFLKNGACSVTGVDLSSEMLKIAASRLKSYRDRLELLNGDFMTVDFGAPFDVVTAIGVFDYVTDSLSFMKKAMTLTSKRFIATFPRAGTSRSLLRTLRLVLKGCPVYFYSKAKIARMAERCEARISRCETVGQLFCVVFTPSDGADRDGPVQA